MKKLMISCLLAAMANPVYADTDLTFSGGNLQFADPDADVVSESGHFVMFDGRLQKAGSYLRVGVRQDVIDYSGNSVEVMTSVPGVSGTIDPPFTAVSAYDGDNQRELYQFAAGMDWELSEAVRFSMELGGSLFESHEDIVPGDSYIIDPATLEQVTNYTDPGTGLTFTAGYPPASENSSFITPHVGIAVSGQHDRWGWAVNSTYLHHFYRSIALQDLGADESAVWISASVDYALAEGWALGLRIEQTEVYEAAGLQLRWSY